MITAAWIAWYALVIGGCSKLMELPAMFIWHRSGGEINPIYFLIGVCKAIYALCMLVFVIASLFLVVIILWPHLVI